jgi:hypothetical protein
VALALSLLLADAQHAASQPDPASVRLTRVALSGEIAPGTDLPFHAFELPIASQTGEVLFKAWLSIDESGSFATAGIWGPARSLPLGLVALEGELAPGAAPTERYVAFGDSFLAADGRLGFTASLTEGDSEESGVGLWAQRDGELLTLVTRTGAPAPGAVEPFAELRRPILDRTGRVGFRGSVATGPARHERDAGLWASSSAALELLAREGDPAVGAPGDTRFDDPLSLRRLTDQGEAYFQAGMRADGERIASTSGLYRKDAQGAVELLHRTGVAIPTLPPGEVVLGFGTPQVNERGDWAISGRIRRESPPEEQGIFVGPANEPLHLLARSGDPAPGAPDGAFFAGFGNALIDASGRITFSASVPSSGRILGASVVGIWGTDSAGALFLHLLSDTPAPGFPDGTMISGISGPHAMSEAGDVLFSAALRGPGLGPGRDGVLYLASEGTPPTPLLTEGHVLEVRPGDLRTVATIAATSRPDVGLRTLGGGGAAVRLAFTDGSSGIFRVALLKTIDVRIDARPRNPAGRVNPRSAGLLQVAILGSERLDASDVDRETLALGPAGAAARFVRLRDVNGDGVPDLLAAFRTSESNIAPDADQVCLSGATLDGVPLRGCDVIETVPAMGHHRGR